jgi:hypothetical protein
MPALRLLLLLATLLLGRGLGGSARLPAVPPADWIGPVQEPGDPAHPQATARLVFGGLSARPPTPGHCPEGRATAGPEAPAWRFDAPAVRLSRPAAGSDIRHGASKHSPYYPNAPPLL